MCGWRLVRHRHVPQCLRLPPAGAGDRQMLRQESQLLAANEAHALTSRLVADDVDRTGDKEGLALGTKRAFSEPLRA